MKIAYDCTLKQPGCVLLQAAMGADVALAHRFNPDHWLLAPTPDLKVYEVTDQQMEQLLVITEAAHP
jgi:hypothetical protein